MMTEIDGEYGGSFSAGLAMEWLKEKEGKKPKFELLFDVRSIGRTVRSIKQEQSPVTEGHYSPIDRTHSLIDRTVR